MLNNQLFCTLEPHIASSIMGYTLLVDNYDSFTWNIYADIATLKGNPLVRRNDKISIQDVQVRAVRAVCQSGGARGRSQQ